MFTGIIECMGEIVALDKDNNNLHITIQSPISHELKIDQSVAHNGVCLTVVALEAQSHTVTAIHETLIKTDLGHWQLGQKVNMERCLSANARFDGHIVQGHADTVARCSEIKDQGGSWLFTFIYEHSGMTVEKGSITVNGTSLTVVNSQEQQFSVAIIPYTYEHTIFHQLKVNDSVNIEFDIVGKYIQKLFQQQIGH